ncbi:MAG TPA: hypothetical protein VMM76_09450 [Pirellulaceae bacterium]|nr:hypothetical protein [Pirellulaceae bacterium]
MTRKKQLSVERLEPRTVLSATNLLASALDIGPGFADRFEWRERPAFFAQEFETRNIEFRDALANRFEPRPLRVGNPEFPERIRVVRAEAIPEQVEVRSTAERTELFAEQLFDIRFDNLDVDRPELDIVNRDRFFSALDGQYRDGLTADVPGERSQPLRSPATNVGDEFNSIAAPADTSPLLTNLSSAPLADGLIELPSQQLSDSKGSLVTPRRYAVNNAEKPPIVTTPWGGTEFSSRPFFTSHHLAVVGAESSFTESLLTVSAGEIRRHQSEGGLVEFEFDRMEEAMADRSSVASPLPSDDFWWHELRRARESFWLEFSADAESQLATDVAEHLAEETSTTAAQTQIADSDIQVDVEEGGMIELLAAAGPQTEQPCVRSNSGSSSPRPTSDKVRMDTGVGLFQVFEIATSPHDSGLEADPAPGANVANKNAETPFAEQAAAIPGDADAEPIRAASLSALLIATSLCFDRDQRHRDQRRKEKPW